MRRLTRLLGIVAWPAFLGAAATEIAVFAFVDPHALHGLDGEALGWSPTTVYSIAFFVFWALACGTCSLTWLLARSGFEVNAAGRWPARRS